MAGSKHIPLNSDPPGSSSSITAVNTNQHGQQQHQPLISSESSGLKHSPASSISSGLVNSTETTNSHAPSSEYVYDDDDDYLEFRLKDPLDGIMRFDATKEGPPQVIRHSMSESTRSSIDTSRTHPQNPFQSSSSHSLVSSQSNLTRNQGGSSAALAHHNQVYTASNSSQHSVSRPSLQLDTAAQAVTSAPAPLSSASVETPKHPKVSPQQEHLNRLARKEQLELEKSTISPPATPKTTNPPKTPKTSATNDSDDDMDWQEMPTVASYDVYNDKNERVVMRKEDYNEEYSKRTAYNLDESKGESKYGYTRITAAADDDLKDELDESTDFLFDEDEFKRSPLAQLETTKKMLSDSQRIAYVGLCRLAMIEMATELAQISGSFRIGKKLSDAQHSMARWAQLMIMRLYKHMDLSPEEQRMIELLSAHGIEPTDLSPSLLKSAKVENPFFDKTRPPTDTPTLHPTTTHGSRAEVEDLHYENPESYSNDREIEIDVRWTLLCDLFLVLLSDSIYDARSRTLMMHVGQYLDVSNLEIAQFEKKVTDALELDEASNQTWNEKDIMEERRKKALKKKYIYVGLATIGGGLVLGLSAGLLAPVIGAGLAAGLSTIGISGTASFLAGAGGTAIVTTTGIAFGTKIGLQGMNRRMGHVKTFEFRPLHNNKRVNLIVTVSGWLVGKEDDVRLPFSTIDPVMGDVYSLLWEPEMLTSMGQTINILATEILTQSVQQILGSTILVALMASIQLPMALSKLGYLLDNPWNVSLDRAWASGLILADTLIRRNLGVRPVTLVGFSLGARVIYSCLVELARQGMHGLVQDVLIFGAPIVIKKDQFKLARSVVSGRFVNGYSKKDWILGYLFRATSGGLGLIAGLAPIKDVPSVENVDVTEHVEGHMGYRVAMPRLLMDLGWEVSSEEFEEIEDPDPDQHRERQRQLMEEFDDARKQMEKEATESEAGVLTRTGTGKSKGKKKKGLFNWLKPKEKELWDMYDREIQDAHKKDEAAAATTPASGPATPGSGSSTPRTTSSDIIFDVDAIRKELEELGRQGANVSAGTGIITTQQFDFDNDEVPLTKAGKRSLEAADTANRGAKNVSNQSGGHVQMVFDDGYDSADEDPFADDRAARMGQKAPYVLPHTVSSPALPSLGGSPGAPGAVGSLRGGAAETLHHLRNGRSSTLSQEVKYNDEGGAGSSEKQALGSAFPAAPPRSTVHKHVSAISRGPSEYVERVSVPPPVEESPWADEAPKTTSTSGLASQEATKKPEIKTTSVASTGSAAPLGSSRPVNPFGDSDDEDESGSPWATSGAIPSATATNGSYAKGQPSVEASKPTMSFDDFDEDDGYDTKYEDTPAVSKTPWSGRGDDNGAFSSSPAVLSKPVMSFDDDIDDHDNKYSSKTPQTSLPVSSKGVDNGASTGSPWTQPTALSVDHSTYGDRYKDSFRAPTVPSPWSDSTPYSNGSSGASGSASRAPVQSTASESKPTMSFDDADDDYDYTYGTKAAEPASKPESKPAMYFDDDDEYGFGAPKGDHIQMSFD